MANTNAVDMWVEHRLRATKPDATWEPDPADGLRRLNERLNEPSRIRKVAPLMAIAAAGLLAAFFIWWPLSSSSSSMGTAPLSVDASPARDYLTGGRLASPAERSDAVSLIGFDINGKEIRISDYRGQVVLLNYWATWCRPCRLEMPWFEEFSSRLGQLGLSVVGVSLDEERWSQIVPFLAGNDIRYQILTVPEDQVNAIKTLPVTLLIDRDGRVAASHVGLVDRDAVESQLVQLLVE